ncbi:T9SS type B sorting domain-containing protein [Flavobacterium alkalisoli]|uniref:T9SS type B sorting domain-containing protein n=1 Tax=Flavobacterium alkalisoli TaxID=2602769 RepID=A0A5B9FU25_9FLAO|nr:choice-of-anchor L domain-containing protein [Flavobacterium alkalisoli]QEE49749.1 T9SS type B sorting domain-containing protein [Flavobacterium alkalisoli]
MRKITLIIFMVLYSFLGYSQLTEEGFEGAWPPTGWTIEDNGNGLLKTWQQSVPGSFFDFPYEGSYAAFMDREDAPAGVTPQDWLITPQFNVPGNPLLKFYSRLTIGGDQGGVYRIMVSSDPDPSNLAAYEEVMLWTEEEINPDQTEYTLINVNLPAALTGTNIYLAFVMEADNADRWLIDKVSVFEECIIPQNLNALNISLDSADLTWDDFNTNAEWDIELLEGAGTTIGSGEVYNGSLPYSVSDLDPGTEYKFYVRALCDTGEESAWAGPFYFNTIAQGDSCDAPIIAVSLPYSDSGNTANHANIYSGAPGTGCGTLFWEEYLMGNDVVYQYTANFTGEITVNLTEASNFSGVFVYQDCASIGAECLAGATTGFESISASIPSIAVTDGEDYYIVISSSSSFVTPYTIAIQQVNCDPPVGLPTVSDMTSVELSWSNPTAATSWEVVIQSPGSGLPTGSGETATVNTNYLVEDLTAGTLYEYYVRSDCEDGTFSAWAGPYVFNTLICEASEQCNYTFTLTDIAGNGWDGNTMNVSQNGVTIAVLGETFDWGSTAEVTVPVCHGIPVQLYWNGGGFNENEVGVTVHNSFGQTVYQKAPGEGFQDTLLYEGDVDCNTISCLAPFTLTLDSATLNSVTLSWDGDATGNWEYYIVEEGGAAPDGSTTGLPATTNPFTVEGLDPATNYDFYIRMVCDGTATPTSTWGGPHLVSTLVCPPENQCEYTFVMTSDFGGGYLGNTMTITQGGVFVTTIGSTFAEGDSQTITVPLCSGQPFEVYWNSGATFEIGLEIINPFEQTLFSLTIGEDVPSTIVYTGDVDCDNPACIPPADLTATNATLNTIDLGWEGASTGNWEYYITEAGNPAPQPETEGEGTTTNPVTASGLTAATNYEYYVRIICEGGVPGEWAGPFAFNTTVCELSEQCVYKFELTSALGWGWENTTMTVYQAGVPIATLGPGFEFGSSYNVEIPLCSNAEIEVFWNTDGWGNPADKGLVIYTPYMETFFEMEPGTGEQGTTVFTGTPNCDAPPCPKPQELTVTDITFTDATVSWAEMGTAENWEVAILPSGLPEPASGTPVIETSYTTSELSSGTAYVFYVRAVCGGGNGNSTWSGPFAFITPIENDNCDTATVATVNPGIECVESVSGVMNGATASGITSNCTWTTPLADIWFQFTAINEVQSISLSNHTGEVMPFHAVFEGDCDGLTEIACNYESYGSTLTGLTIGETYWVQVYIDGGSPELNSIVSFDFCVYTPVGNSIIIDQEEYTVDEIVNDILIQSECGQVSNITWSTGIDNGAVSNGIAYFSQGTTDFPLKEGVLLTTGRADQATGPNNTSMGNGPLGEGDWWPGDDQLFDYVQESGINPFLMSLNQASILEFDFVPVTNHIKFPFVFASEEYNGTGQCFFSDAFGFFLTDPDGNVTNLGVIPGTTIPVTSKTIRDEAYVDPFYEFPCESQYPELFDKYYGPYNGLDPMTAPTNFNGHTVVMYAEADVVPGQTYHIKMVVADDLDTGNDTGIFIGQFDLGNVDIGEDLTLEGGSALCAGTEYTIDSGLDETLYTITWYQDGEVIEGETGASLTVTESGEYTIEVIYMDTTCGGSDSVIIEYFDPIEDVTSTPVDLIVCAEGDTAQFDFTQNTELILAGQNPEDFTITYHESQEDADNNEAALESPYTNTSNPQAIYARVQVTGGECYVVYSFNLIVSPQYTADVLEDVTECNSYILPQLSENNNYYTGSEGTGEMLTAGTEITVTQLIYIYAQSTTQPGCADESSFTVNINPTPSFSIGDTYEVCDPSFAVIEVMPENFDLAEATYEWTYEGDILAETSPILQADDFGTYSVTVSLGDCSFTQTTIVIEDTDAVAFEIDHGCEGTVYMIHVVPVDDSFDPSTADISWTGPDGFNTSQPSSEITEEGIYTVTIVTTEGCSVQGSVEISGTGCLIPRGISPNNDGMNDNFNLEGLNVTNLIIFNRYGKEVYSFSGNYTNEWYGQGNNGNDLPTGTYFYSIERSGGESKTGWVYINRQDN